MTQARGTMKAQRGGPDQTGSKPVRAGGNISKGRIRKPSGGGIAVDGGARHAPQKPARPPRKKKRPPNKQPKSYIASAYADGRKRLGYD